MATLYGVPAELPAIREAVSRDDLERSGTLFFSFQDLDFTKHPCWNSMTSTGSGSRRVVRMAELLLGLGVLAIAGGLVVGVAAYRRRRLVDVYRQEGERLVAVAQVLIFGGLILAFVVLTIINNR